MVLIKWGSSKSIFNQIWQYSKYGSRKPWATFAYCRQIVVNFGNLFLKNKILRFFSPKKGNFDRIFFLPTYFLQKWRKFATKKTPLANIGLNFDIGHTITLRIFASSKNLVMDGIIHCFTYLKVLWIHNISSSLQMFRLGLVMTLWWPK